MEIHNLWEIADLLEIPRESSYYEQLLAIKEAIRSLKVSKSVADSDPDKIWHWDYEDTLDGYYHIYDGEKAIACITAPDTKDNRQEMGDLVKAHNKEV